MNHQHRGMLAAALRPGHVSVHRNAARIESGSYRRRCPHPARAAKRADEAPATCSAHGNRQCRAPAKAESNSFELRSRGGKAQIFRKVSLFQASSEVAQPSAWLCPCDCSQIRGESLAAFSRQPTQPEWLCYQNAASSCTTIMYSRPTQGSRFIVKVHSAQIRPTRQASIKFRFCAAPRCATMARELRTIRRRHERVCAGEKNKRRIENRGDRVPGHSRDRHAVCSGAPPRARAKQRAARTKKPRLPATRTTARNFTAATAASSVTAPKARERWRSLARASARRSFPSRDSPRNSATPAARCRPIPAKSSPTRTSPTSTPTCNPGRKPRPAKDIPLLNQ